MTTVCNLHFSQSIALISHKFHSFHSGQQYIYPNSGFPLKTLEESFRQGTQGVILGKSVEKEEKSLKNVSHIETGN